MSRRRFYAHPGAFSHDDGSLILEAEESRHLRDVLRLTPDDDVYVFDGEGKEFLCAINEIRRNFVKLKVISQVEPARPESPLRLTLAAGLLKGEKFDLVVQKTSELGIYQIIPLVTTLSDVHLREVSDAEKRVRRWQRIALEAAKQSGRAFVPQIAQPEIFEVLVQRHNPTADQRGIMFSERNGHSLPILGENSSQNPSAIVALVGPEGGWTDSEIDEARKAGWSIVTLGGRVLRAETSAIVVTALLQHLFGDLS